MLLFLVFAPLRFPHSDIGGLSLTLFTAKALACTHSRYHLCSLTAVSWGSLQSSAHELRRTGPRFVSRARCPCVCAARPRPERLQGCCPLSRYAVAVVVVVDAVVVVCVIRVAAWRAWGEGGGGRVLEWVALGAIDRRAMALPYSGGGRQGLSGAPPAAGRAQTARPQPLHQLLAGLQPNHRPGLAAVPAHDQAMPRS